jgi:hypothetical protein
MAADKTRKRPALSSQIERAAFPSPLWNGWVLSTVLVAENLTEEQLRPLVLRITKEFLWFV